MMASEYKKRGGGYTTDKKDKDESQKHLDQWTEEEWQTKEGSGHAKQEDGTEARYLPKKAWERMSEQEKNETNEKKQEASKEGQQYVSNTAAAKEARKEATKDSDKDEASGVEGREEGSESETAEDGAEGAQQREDSVHRESSENVHDGDMKGIEADGMVEGKSESKEKEGTENETELQQKPSTKTSKKRSSGANQKGANKRQKGGSNKGEGPNGTAGDKTRMPEKGQQVQWRSLQGYVDGEVIEVAYETKTVDGKAVKANKDDPRVVLKSATSGKIAVHKPEAVYFT
jgi:hypothetical protein